MTTIVKFSGYAIDRLGNLKGDELERGIEEFCDYPLLHHLHTETAVIDEDDNTLYCDNPDLAECEKYFKPEPSQRNRDVVVGAIYRHFKGNLVKVLAVSQDTEHPGAWSVVYQSLTINPGTIWHRPYDMFVSKVDHKKYPDEVQKYRFELVR